MNRFERLKVQLKVAGCYVAIWYNIISLSIGLLDKDEYIEDTFKHVVNYIMYNEELGKDMKGDRLKLVEAMANVEKKAP